MAENTRSKSTKRQNHKTQFENHSNLSDEEMVAETYKANEKASFSTQATKKLKKTEDFSSPLSPNNNDNNMVIDDKNEMEHPISSEPDIYQQNNSDKGITQGSADTQITPDTNNDVNSHNLEIFKEYNSRSDSQYILFFTRDQFDKEKSNNEILNDLKNAFLMENDIIEYKTNKKATIEFYTILIGTEITFNKLKEKPVALLNSTAPKIYSREAIDNLINYNINNLRARSVNLLNVPINYDINLLIKHIANFTSSVIDSYKEFIPNRRNTNRNLPSRIKYNLRSPTYKKVTLTFNKPNAVEYLLSQHKWGILIENFLIRIVPIDDQQHNFKHRTTPTQNSYTLNDNVKLSYDQIKPLMSSQRNRPNLHGRYNTRPSPNQGYQTKTPNNSTFTSRDKHHNRGPASHSTIVPDNDMDNWDFNPNNANVNKPTIKGKTKGIRQF
ncbi:unnamed protein product [Rhizophagus irregularis]|nr:unnamed protein product [Rhizophagus irregularis]